MITIYFLQVTAEVFPPNSKKSVLRVDGEWNGKLMAKYASGQNEVFMDVSKIPIHKKICRKVALQDPFESRRLWRQVTYGLKVRKAVKYQCHGLFGQKPKRAYFCPLFVSG